MNINGARIDLSSAGIKFGYAVETTAGTKPTTFTWIKGAKSLPSVNEAPSTLETTTLDETDYKTYIDGLKDTGGALEITFNHTEQFQGDWESLVDEYNTAKASDKSTWFEFYVPGLTKGFFFRGNPSALGFNGAEVDSVLEAVAYVIPVGDIGYDTAIEPTATTMSEGM